MSRGPNKKTKYYDNLLPEEKVALMEELLTNAKHWYTRKILRGIRKDALKQIRREKLKSG